MLLIFRCGLTCAEGIIRYLRLSAMVPLAWLERV